MDDKNKREKENLFHWGEEYSAQQKDNIFTSINFENASYWIQRTDSENYLTEYGFDSVPELKNCLDSMWKYDEIMSDIEKSVLVAAIKNKVVADSDRLHIKSEHIVSLPEFIYNF